MEDGPARIRGIVKEELERLLAEQERQEAETGAVPPHPRSLSLLFRPYFEIAGALLLGILCGILSHVGVMLFVWALS